MKKGAYAFITFLLLVAMILPAIAEMNHKMVHQAEGETKIIDGVKGRFKVTPAMSMLDLYLVDAKTEKTITGAKVKTIITMPDGKKAEKDLTGMKMGETFSYMSTMDFSLKGVYTFDIAVDVQNKAATKEFDKKRANFSFTYEVR